MLQRKLMTLYYMFATILNNVLLVVSLSTYVTVKKPVNNVSKCTYGNKLLKPTRTRRSSKIEKTNFR